MSEVVSKDCRTCVNSIYLLLTAKQEYDRKYYASHREARHAYYFEHIDHIKAWQTTKVQCQCGGRYSLARKSKHEKTNILIKSLEIA